jgi:hypothetical protein
MKKEIKQNRWIICLYILLFVVYLYILCRIGFSIYLSFLIGIVILLFLFLKGKLYKKLDHFLNNKFHFLSKLKPWVRKLMIIAGFVLIYLLLKQVIFAILKVAGLDVQKMITNSINKLIQ